MAEKIGELLDDRHAAPCTRSYRQRIAGRRRGAHGDRGRRTEGGEGPLRARSASRDARRPREPPRRPGKVRGLPRFGERSEQQILKALAFAQQRPDARRSATCCRSCATIEALRRPGRRRAGRRSRARSAAAGRRSATSTCSSSRRRPDAVMAAFAALPQVARVVGRGDTKMQRQARDGLQVDLRVVTARELRGRAPLLHRQQGPQRGAPPDRASRRAQAQRVRPLSRRAPRSPGGPRRRSTRASACAWIPPELREDQGEIEAARARHAAARSSSPALSAAISRRRPTGPTAPTRSRRWRAPRRRSASSTSRSPTTP